MGSGGGKKQTSTNEPSAEAKPYLSGLYQQAGNSLGPSMQTALGPEQQQSWNIQRDVIGGAGQGGPQYQQMALDMLGGKYTDPAQNQQLQAAIGATQQPLIDQFQRQVLPSIGSQAIQQGAFGGSRQGVAEGLAAGDLTRNLGQIAAQMNFQNYGMERQNQLNADQFLQRGVGLQLQPAQLLDRLTQSRQNAIWQPTQQFSNIVQGMPNYGTSTTGTSGGQFGNLATGALGGAATGAAIGSVVPGIGTAIGAAGGGILGGLGGLFG